MACALRDADIESIDRIGWKQGARRYGTNFHDSGGRGAQHKQWRRLQNMASSGVRNGALHVEALAGLAPFHNIVASASKPPGPGRPTGEPDCRVELRGCARLRL